MKKVNKHGGVLFFGPTLHVSSFQGKSRSYEIFSRQKSLFALLANEKNAYWSAYAVPRGKFYSFNVPAAIDREDTGVDYGIPETKPSTRLILYLSLADFVYGFSLLDPYVAYAKNNDENSVNQNNTEEGDIVPPRRTVPRSKQVSRFGPVNLNK